MKKRVLSLFLVLAMCLTLLPTAALAGDEDSTDDAVVQEQGEPEQKPNLEQESEPAPEQEPEQADTQADSEEPVEPEADAIPQSGENGGDAVTEGCEHNWSNGVCTLCGVACAHSKATEQDDGKYTCNTCGTQMVARTGESQYDDVYYADIVTALNNAPMSSEVILLTDVTIEGDMNYAGGEGEDKDLALNLNGHNFTCTGTFSIGKGKVEFDSGGTQTGASLSFSGLGNINANIVVKLDGSFGLYPWEGGTVTSVCVEATSDGSGIGGSFGSPAPGIDGTVKKLQLDGKNYALHISGGKYGEIINNTGSDIPFDKILYSGYAFYQGETPVDRTKPFANGETLKNVTVKKCTAHADSNNDQKCDYCNTSIIASVTTESGETTYYETLSDAFKAANKNTGCTLTLLSDVSASNDFPFVTGNFTLDLNGHKLNDLYVGQDYNIESNEKLDEPIPGSLTIVDNSQGTKGSITEELLLIAGTLNIQDGIIGKASDDGFAGSLSCDSGTVTISGGAVYGLTAAEGASVTVSGGSGHRGSWINDGGALTITGGTFDSVIFNNMNGGTTAISGGTFGTITNHNGSSTIPAMSLLAEGYAFYNGETVQNGSTGKSLENVTVQLHNHTFGDNSECACGVASAASVTVDDVTTYYTDLQAAIDNASNGTVKLLQKIELDEDVTFNNEKSDNVTLDMNGYSLITSAVTVLTVSRDMTICGERGTIYSSYSGQETVNSVVLTGGHLTIKGYGFNAYGGKGEKCALYAAGGSLTVEDGLFGADVVIESNCAVEIKNGTFYKNVSIASPNAKISGGEFEGEGAVSVSGAGAVISSGLFNGEVSISGAGAEISGGTFGDMVTIKNSSKAISGGGFGYKLINQSGTVEDLLADGYAFKHGSDYGITDWLTESELAGESVLCVDAVTAPITSVSLTANQTTVKYGEASGVTLTAECTADGEGAVTQEWYLDDELIDMTDSTSYTLPEGSPAGTHTYRVVFTKDGYSKSAEITITVNAIDITTATVTPAALTYNGQEQAPAVEVKLGETPLMEGTDYTVTVDKQTNAGTYTLTVTGKGNYDGKKENVEWTISPTTLTISDATVPFKDYDGTTAATVSGVTFDGLVGDESLTIGTDYTVTGAFQSATANLYTTQPVTVTVTLADSVKNYTLDGRTFVKQGCMIEKAPSTGLSASLVIRNGICKIYEIVLPDLPTLNGNKTYGKIAYSIAYQLHPVTGYETNATLVDTDSAPKLRLEVTAANGDLDGYPLGLITIHVVTDNYQDIPIMVDVTAKNKTTPTGQPTLTPDSITYGDTLDSITLSGGLKDRDTDVPGTFTWTDGSFKPDAGYCEAEWRFVPADGDSYTETTGRVGITIGRKSISGAEITLGNALTYNGAEQTRTVASFMVDGVTLTAGQDYTISANSGTNAGSYTLTIQGKGNYTGTVTADWIIAAKTVAPRITLEGDSFPYDNGNEIKPAVTVKDGETEIPASEYTVFYANNINAGTATVVISNKEGGNYQVKEVSTDFTITKVDSVITAAPTANTLTYNGTEQPLVIAGAAVGGTLQYGTGVTLDDRIPAATSAGIYTVYYIVKGDANHNDSDQQSITVTIAQAEVTVTAENKTSRIGQELLPLTYTRDPAPFAGDSFTGELATAADMNTAGETAITQGTLKLNDNYILTFVPGIYTVAAKQPQSSFAFAENEQTKTFDDADFTIAAIGAAADSTVTYTSSDTTVATVDNHGTVHIVGAGQTVITATATETADDLEGTASYTLTVARKSITAPAADATVYTYNGEAQTYQLAAGEGYTISGSLTETNANEAGYAITVSLNDKDNTKWAGSNEDTADKTYTFIIHQAAVTITAQDKSAYVNSTAPDLSNPVQNTDYTVDGLIGNDTLASGPSLRYDPETPDMTKTGSDTKIIVEDADAGDNYAITYVDGKLVITTRPSSGGSSSNGSTTTKTEITTNADGSTTKTETKSDGTVVETTTRTDGSTTRTETKTDGSSVTESKTANGSTGTVKTVAGGKTEAEAKISTKAVEDAKKADEAVKVPTEVKAGENPNSAPTVKVELPKSAGETKIEIPVENVNSGTVAVIVHEDGTEEIVKDTIPTEDGVQLTVDGNTTVKVIDNSKDFIDTKDHWAKDAIDFVSARELVNGVSSTLYAPDASTTRAQLWTILARQNDADLTGGTTWYEKAQAWSKTNGISDGSDPNGTITRAQMVTMLWRAAGSPEAQITSSFTDVAADSYYTKAVAWAVEHGITTGTGSGKFSPNDTCTRAQIAAFLMRSYQGK